jgi:hypothetical protein
MDNKAAVIGDCSGREKARYLAMRALSRLLNPFEMDFLCC